MWPAGEGLFVYYYHKRNKYKILYTNRENERNPAYSQSCWVIVSARKT